MKRLALASVVVMAACGGGGGGEPIGGDLVIDWGDTHAVADSGAAIANPEDQTQLVVAMGDAGFDCGWATARVHSGDTYDAFFLDESMQAVGDYPSAFIIVTHADGDGVHSNGASGMLSITAFGERITGSLSMTTTDDVAGPVSTSGTFDVLNCL